MYVGSTHALTSIFSEFHWTLFYFIFLILASPTLLARRSTRQQTRLAAVAQGTRRFGCPLPSVINVRTNISHRFAVRRSFSHVQASLDMYGKILTAIEANNFDNFRKRAYISKTEKLLTLPFSYAKSLNPGEVNLVSVPVAAAAAVVVLARSRFVVVHGILALHVVSSPHPCHAIPCLSMPHPPSLPTRPLPFNSSGMCFVFSPLACPGVLSVDI